VVEKAHPRLPDGEITLRVHTGTRAVARLAVHRALRELTEAGSLRRVHGVGTYVASTRPESPLTRLHNIADEIRARGERLTSRVLRLQRVRADAALAALFDLDRGQPLFHSVVVYAGNGLPLQLEDRYVLPSFAPDYLAQDFTRGSTTDYLQAIAPATDAEIVIDALIPEAAEARLLELGPQEPALAVTRKTWVGSRVTTWTRFLHPGGRHRIVLRNLGSLLGGGHAPR
ncbi:UTRA domain-containing protein, partial [Thalassobaculum salexigens]|uniref:UTRA domain-containing protein n=1 Tax=Thalassobaculum salexigens TaxID=455360 RepID=UPI00248DA6FD